MSEVDHTIITVLYRNHRGNVANRHIRPIRMWFGSTCFHPQPQWFIECFCLSKQATRDFALLGFCADGQAQ